MILYFADKYMNVLRVAGDRLKDGLRIADDMKTSELTYGSDVFECTVCYRSDEYALIDRLSEAGGYLLRAGDSSYECYTILESENKTEDGTCWISGESAGLDNVNEILEPYEAPYAMTLAQYMKKMDAGAGYSIGADETGGKKLKLVFDSAQPAAERYLALAASFGMELSYSFEVGNMQVTGMFINFHKRRGRMLGRPLRAGHEIRPLTIKKSMLNFATAILARGGAPSSQTGYKTPSGKYIWVKWSNSADGSEMANTPSSRAYIGIAYYKASEEKSSEPGDYIWTQIKSNGAYSGTGILRKAGNYTWIRYSQYIDGSGMSANPIGKRYIGIALGKTTATCSSNPKDYIWYPVTEDSADPITLEGMKYDDGDIYIKGRYIYSRSARRVWNRCLASGSGGTGDVIVDFESDTKDQNELLQQSVRELRTRGRMEKSYSTELLDTGIRLRVGDTVPLIDDRLGIRLSARISKLEESQCDGTVFVTFGEYEEIEYEDNVYADYSSHTDELEAQEST